MAKYSIVGSFFDIRKTKFYKIFNPKKYKYAMKDEKYWHKIKAWPSGVELPIENSEKKNTDFCILYSKKISTPSLCLKKLKKCLMK